MAKYSNRQFSFWLRRLPGSGLLAGYHLRAKVDQNKFPQVFRWTRGVRSPAHADDVSGDLDGRENESPRKTPPAEEKGECNPAELPLDGAGMTTDLRLGRPSGQNQSRPDLMNFVNVNRADTPAFGAVATPDFLDFAFQYVVGNIFGDAQDVSVPGAFIVAEALVAGADTANDDG